jgi:hypothetical protein
MESVTIERLKELCEEYDNIVGIYPERECVGASIVDFIQHRLKYPDKEIKCDYKRFEFKDGTEW